MVGADGPMHHQHPHHTHTHDFHRAPPTHTPNSPGECSPASSAPVDLVCIRLMQSIPATASLPTGRAGGASPPPAGTGPPESTQAPAGGGGWPAGVCVSYNLRNVALGKWCNLICTTSYATRMRRSAGRDSWAPVYVHTHGGQHRSQWKIIGELSPQKGRTTSFSHLMHMSFRLLMH